ncbi:MAG: WbqC family protein, partial [Boseongicola sp.]
MTTVSILQSNYVPWRGYFDIIRRSDFFVFYDEVQYTKNDWRNRNVIVPSSGPKWLSLPIDTSGKFGQPIFEALIKDANWAEKHFAQIHQVYRGAPTAHLWMSKIEELYGSLASEQSLSRVNQKIIREICSWLGIQTVLKDSREIPGVTGKSERLVGIVGALNGTHYLSGPSAQSYLDTSLFDANGIQVCWMEYSEYPHYVQQDGQYRAGVSILDSLLMAPEAS